MLENLKVAIIGLGYVGLPLAVEFGKKYPTVGFDISQKRIDELSNGQDSTLEVSPDNLKQANLLQYSSNLETLKHSNFFIVTVPTPIDDVNRPDLVPLQKASETIGKVLKKGDVVVYESTVYPGATEEVCIPVLEKVSGLKFNQDFFAGYSPERINPGDKINTLTKIKKITSGSTLEIAQMVDQVYASIITAGTHKASSIKVAEAAKVIENTQRDLNIALVNELSVIFERIGIDTLDVLEAAGSKWNFLPFRPGLVGGHCIGVDPYYLTHKAEEVGYNPQVILAGRRINDNMARYVARRTIKLIVKNGIDVSKAKIGILGITFKENCPDIRNSKVVDIIYEFKQWGIETVVMDPWADNHEVRDEYNIELSTIDENHQVDALIVAVGHHQFRELTAQKLRQWVTTDKPVLADVKSIFNRIELTEAGFTVFRL